MISKITELYQIKSDTVSIKSSGRQFWFKNPFFGIFKWKFGMLQWLFGTDSVENNPTNWSWHSVFFQYIWYGFIKVWYNSIARMLRMNPEI